jgi:hypothetical protein
VIQLAAITIQCGRQCAVLVWVIASHLDAFAQSLADRAARLTPRLELPYIQQPGVLADGARTLLCTHAIAQMLNYGRYRIVHEHWRHRFAEARRIAIL